MLILIICINFRSETINAHMESVSFRFEKNTVMTFDCYVKRRQTE